MCSNPVDPRKSLDSAGDAFERNELQKCLALLKSSKRYSCIDEDRSRIVANTILCEAKMKGRVYHSDFRNSLQLVFPQLKSASDVPSSFQSSAEATVAFNMAVSAFAQGTRKTAIELLTSVLATKAIDGKLSLAASLFAIEVSLASSQIRLALEQIASLRDSPKWIKANASQRDLVECFDARARCKLPSIDVLPDLKQKPNTISWCLVQTELAVKAGNASSALHRLFAFRSTAKDEDRCIIENAIGCVYAISLKKYELADGYYRSSMGFMKRMKQKSGDSTMPKFHVIYNSALAQLHSGEAESAFGLFRSITPYFHGQPRVWLRMAECCMQVLLRRRREEERSWCKIGERYLIFTSSDRSVNAESDEYVTSEISWDVADQCIRTALIFAEGRREHTYLMPWLYAAAAYINLNLGRHGLTVRWAMQLASASQPSSLHMLMSSFLKAEALASMDKVSEAIKCLEPLAPLHHYPKTFIAILYNQAWLQALAGANTSVILNKLKKINEQKDTQPFHQAQLLLAHTHLSVGSFVKARDLADRIMLGRRLYGWETL